MPTQLQRASRESASHAAGYCSGMHAHFSKGCDRSRPPIARRWWRRRRTESCATPAHPAHCNRWLRRCACCGQAGVHSQTAHLRQWARGQSSIQEVAHSGRQQRRAAACRYALPPGLTIDLLPIVEDGLFGYELLPDRNTHTYVTIGCNAQGEPVLRKTLYGLGAPNALQLVTVNGHILSRSERASRYSTQQRDAHFPDWPAAAESACAQLLLLFPERPRQPFAVGENVHRCLDEALSIAHSHLAHWDPFIHFGGLPNEAQQGIALKGVNGEHGELVFQRPDIWMLRWKAPPQAIYESWSVVLPDLDAARDTAHRDLAS